MMVTSPVDCNGNPMAAKCNKAPADPAKKAIKLLAADGENSKAKWMPETVVKMGEQEPITVCEAEIESEVDAESDAEEEADNFADIESMTEE
jgi:hypothetical protein